MWWGGVRKTRPSVLYLPVSLLIGGNACRCMCVVLCMSVKWVTETLPNATPALRVVAPIGCNRHRLGFGLATSPWP